MIKSIICSTLFCSILISTYCSGNYNGSTTASVILAGSIIKTQNIDTFKKYKRKDCPVCQGKGWYISGDKITKVQCGYCEPDNKTPGISNNNPVCNGPQCTKPKYPIRK